MSTKSGNGDRADKITKELLESGWQQVIVGATVVYQKPAPVREQKESKKEKPKRKS